jgi:hypothetical protein
LGADRRRSEIAEEAARAVMKSLVLPGFVPSLEKTGERSAVLRIRTRTAEWTDEYAARTIEIYERLEDEVAPLALQY